MISTDEIGLASERVQCSTDIDLSDVHCSTICENILWKAVACQQCETHFCSNCITQWLNQNPNQCPMRCDNFVQRPCSKFIARQLAKLQIVCIYQPNGCNEVVSYEALEKHERMCDYKLVKCSACLLEMPQKNIPEHQFHCTSVLKTCENCQIAYKQNDPLSHHSETVCLREQFQQYRFAAQCEMNELNAELRKVQRDQIELLVSRGIIKDDNAVKRISLQSTAEMETLNKDRIVLDQDSKMSFNDELLCSTCRDVLWKPVYCGKCGCHFCNKCRPQIGFFNRITTFFGAERPRHGRNNCDTFEEAPVPNHITTDLRQLRARCAYAQNGCRILPFYYDLEQHEQQCEFEKIPCELCQKPLSKRRPVVQHSTHACFEEMHRKNPSGIQQQFIFLLDAIEKTEAENRRLKLVAENLQSQINNLDHKYVKKPEKQDEKK